MVKKRRTFEELENLPVDKWQLSSCKATQAKLFLENILKEYDNNDRQTINYKKLYESIKTIFDHLEEDYNPDYYSNKRKEIKQSWIKGVLIASGGSIITFVIENFQAIINIITSIFGGKQ